MISSVLMQNGRQVKDRNRLTIHGFAANKLKRRNLSRTTNEYSEANPDHSLSCSQSYSQLSLLQSFPQPPELETSFHPLPSQPTVTSITILAPGENPRQKNCLEPLFICCQEVPEEESLCQLCNQSLCPACLELPLRISKCPNCILALCQKCAHSLRRNLPTVQGGVSKDLKP